jgi:hypothetical protein
MKNTKLFLGLTALLPAIIALVLTGCPADADPVTLNSISVTGPAKTAYTVGDTFSAAGLVVSAAYSDGTSAVVTSGYTLAWNGAELANGSAAITTTTGSKIITVMYQDKTTAFKINVSAPPATVTSVTISPDTVTVAKGGTQAFSATVSGTNSPAQTVTWCP